MRTLVIVNVTEASSPTSMFWMAKQTHGHEEAVHVDVHDHMRRLATLGRFQRLLQPFLHHPLHVELPQPISPHEAPAALLLQLVDVGAELRPPGGDVVESGVRVELRQELGISCLGR